MIVSDLSPSKMPANYASFKRVLHHDFQIGKGERYHVPFNEVAEMHPNVRFKDAEDYFNYLKKHFIGLGPKFTIYRTLSMRAKRAGQVMKNIVKGRRLGIHCLI